MSVSRHTYRLTEVGFGVEAALSPHGEPHSLEFDEKFGALRVIHTSNPLATLRAGSEWEELTLPTSPGTVVIPSGTRKIAIEATSSPVVGEPLLLFAQGARSFRMLFDTSNDFWPDSVIELDNDPGNNWRELGFNIGDVARVDNTFLMLPQFEGDYEIISFNVAPKASGTTNDPWARVRRVDGKSLPDFDDPGLADFYIIPQATSNVFPIATIVQTDHQGAENARYYSVDQLNAPAYAVALHDWDYQGILADLTIVTAANGGVDAFGNAITDVAQGGGRVDDGVGPVGNSSPLKPGYGWHLRASTPPGPGNRIELSPNFDATQDWTLESWMNPGTTGGPADGRVIMFARNDNILAETAVVEWVLFANAIPDAVTVEIADESDVTIWASGNVPVTILAAVWYHCAVTFDSVNGQYNVFYDGNRIAQSPVSTAATDPFDAVGNINQSPAVDGAWTETRLSRGIRYSGATYAVPTAPFTISD